jgi:hypothetical protein
MLPEADYPKVEWHQDTDQAGWGTSGYISDGSNTGVVLPEVLVKRYNDLVDELTTLRTDRKALVECIQHVSVAVRAAEIALRKEWKFPGKNLEH